MYDYIFLDLDGTILEGKYKHYKCYTDTVNILEGIPLDINIYWEMKRKRVSLDKILEYSDLRGDKETFLKIWKQRGLRNLLWIGSWRNLELSITLIK